MKADTRTWNVLIGVALVAMVGLWAYDTFAPRPKPKLPAERRIENERRVVNETFTLRQTVAAGEKKVKDFMWTGSVDNIGPQALDRVNRFAREANVKVNAFRPQKSAVDGSVLRLPLVVSLEGTYPAVLAFVRKLEAPENRLAVNLFQVNATDGQSDAVNATVSLMAFMQVTPAPTRPAARGGRS